MIVWPEKSVAQQEIEKETEAADKQKRLNNKAVANLVKKSNRILVSISSHAFLCWCLFRKPLKKIK